MLTNQFAAGVAAARNSAMLDNIARLLWKAHAEGQIADTDAEAIAAAVQRRRAAFASGAGGKSLATVAAARAPRRAPRSPDQQRSLERRRRCAASGALPPQIAAKFTVAEQAVLSIIALEVRQHGSCALCVDAIAAKAGVSRGSVGNAVRLAERLGIILRQERRRRGLPSLTNVITIISREWLAWLRHRQEGGGLKKLRTTDIKQSTTRSFSPSNTAFPHERRDRNEYLRYVSGSGEHADYETENAPTLKRQLTSVIR